MSRETAIAGTDPQQERSTPLGDVGRALRIPAQGIIGATELLAQTPLNADQEQLVGWLRASVRDLTDIINTVAAQIAGTVAEGSADPLPVFDGRVLVVEDDSVNRAVVVRQLARLGVQTHAVATGQEAIAAVAQESFALVLMDVQMPGIGGLDATRSIRAAAEPGARRLPVIALTGNAAEGDRELCLAAGMDGHVAKPVTLCDLRSALRPWLPSAADGADGESAPSVPGFDVGRLLNLARELQGIEGGVAEVLDMYFDELPGRRDAILEALADPARNGLRDVAHALKSTSATFGAVDLAAVCAQIEEAARHGEEPPATAADDLEIECLRADVELHALVADLGARST